MTRQQGTAALAAIFVLCGVAISPLFAAPAMRGGDDRGNVSIAISSGSHLLLTTAGDTSRPTEGARQLTCDHVFSIGLAEVGVNCAQPDSRVAGHPSRLVRLAD